jgi:CheY-like chemotaxis protein
VYGIAKQNKGFVLVARSPGQGTELTVYLPRFRGSGEEAQTAPAARPLAAGRETILLVEDERALLDLAEAVLERQGYTVLAAGTPGAAVRLAGERLGVIDLLLTDVLMPEMNGRDLARDLLSRRPGLKCLFMSGYPADVVAGREPQAAGVDYSQKPFTAMDLAAEVRTSLTASQVWVGSVSARVAVADLRTVTILALDPATFGRVAWTRPGLTPFPPYNNLALLAREPSTAILSDPLHVETALQEQAEPARMWSAKGSGRLEGLAGFLRAEVAHQGVDEANSS